MHTALRIVAQLALTAPIFLLGALAWPFLLIPFTLGFWTELSFTGISMVSGAYGILALPFSIFLPLHLIQRVSWLKIVLVVFLLGGCMTAISILVSPQPKPPELTKIVKGAWIFGGPIAVAIWNITRFLRGSNKPTTDNSGASSLRV